MDERSFQSNNDPFGGYGGDLHPHDRAGTTRDSVGPFSQSKGRSVYDIKDLNRRLHKDLTDDQLQTIMVLPQGTRLEQGSRYLDLAEDHPQEFVARAGMEAGPNNYYVAKSGLDYPLWNYLSGVTNPERLDQE